MTLGWPIVAFLLAGSRFGNGGTPQPFQLRGHVSLLLRCGKGWGWSAACNLVALITALSGIDYGCALFLAPLLGIEASPGHLLWLYALILFSTP